MVIQPFIYSHHLLHCTLKPTTDHSITKSHVRAWVLAICMASVESCAAVGLGCSATKPSLLEKLIFAFAALWCGQGAPSLENSEFAPAINAKACSESLKGFTDLQRVEYSFLHNDPCDCNGANPFDHIEFLNVCKWGTLNRHKEIDRHGFRMNR